MALPDEPVINVSFAAKQYVAAGLVLVAFDRGTKGPTHKGWNQEANCISTIAEASNLYGNIGLAHAYSGTVGLDIDDMELCADYFGGIGIDFWGLWNAPDAVRLTSGRPNRGKLLYRRPTGMPPLATRMFKKHGFELRCATSGGLTVQDVLPPSVHPDTGQPYSWMGPGDWRNLPLIPADVWRHWESLLAPPRAEGPVAPVGMGREDLEQLLANVPVADMGYEGWLSVAMALHYETGGNAAGLYILDAWSAAKGGEFYKGYDSIAAKWEGFRLDHPNPVTLRSVVHMLSGDMSAEYTVVPDDVPSDYVMAAKTPKVAAKPNFLFEPDHVSISRPPTQWLLQGIVPRADLLMTYGASGTGKSFFVYDMCAAIAQGIPWQGLKTVKSRVAWMYAEGASGSANRKRAYAHENGGALPGFIDCHQRPNLMNNTDYKAIGAGIAAAGGCDILVVDTLAASSGGADENSGKDMGLVLGHCLALREATGAVIWLVHHAGKDASKGARGWSGLKAAADLEMEITQTGFGRQATVSKSKDGEAGRVFPFKLKQIILGVDADDNEQSSCVIEFTAPPAAKPKSPTAGMGKNQRLVWNVFLELSGVSGEVDEDVLVIEASNQMAKPGGPDTRKKKVREALDALVSSGDLEKSGSNYKILQID